MPIYVDKIFEFDPLIFKDSNPMAQQASRWGTKWCHMWASTEADLPELHRIAIKIGLKTKYFQNRPRFPHYDLIPSKRKLALQHGAIEKDLREWIKEQKQNDKTTTSIDGLPQEVPVNS